MPRPTDMELNVNIKLGYVRRLAQIASEALAQFADDINYMQRNYCEKCGGDLAVTDEGTANERAYEVKQCHDCGETYIMWRD